MAGNRGEQGALIVAFREGLGFAGVAAIRSPHGIRFAAVGPNGVGPLAPGESGEVCFWCRRAADAERVVAAATTKLSRQSHATDRTLAAAAARFNVALYSDGELAAEAMTAIVRMEEELAMLQRAGALKSVNRSYRTYRLDAAARGEKIIPYARWLGKYKENLVRQIAATLRHF